MVFVHRYDGDHVCERYFFIGFDSDMLSPSSKHFMTTTESKACKRSVDSFRSRISRPLLEFSRSP